MVMIDEPRPSAKAINAFSSASTGKSSRMLKSVGAPYYLVEQFARGLQSQAHLPFSELRMIRKIARLQLLKPPVNIWLPASASKEDPV
jgi:hypothetical protein